MQEINCRTIFTLPFSKNNPSSQIRPWFAGKNEVEMKNIFETFTFPNETEPWIFPQTDEEKLQEVFQGKFELISTYLLTKVLH